MGGARAGMCPQSICKPPNHSYWPLATRPEDFRFMALTNVADLPGFAR